MEFLMENEKKKKTILKMNSLFIFCLLHTDLLFSIGSLWMYLLIYLLFNTYVVLVSLVYGIQNDTLQTFLRTSVSILQYYFVPKH